MTIPLFVAVVLVLSTTVLLTLRLRKTGDAVRYLRLELKEVTLRQREETARADRERREAPVMARRAQEELLVELLQIDDHVARALDHADADPSQLLEGLRLLRKDLDKVWAHVGVVRMELPPGTPFDPQSHEALSLSHVEGLGDQTISEVAQAGFTFEDRLLRPARVVVNRVMDAEVEDPSGMDSPAPEEEVETDAEADAPLVEVE